MQISQQEPREGHQANSHNPASDRCSPTVWHNVTIFGRGILGVQWVLSVTKVRDLAADTGVLAANLCRGILSFIFLLVPKSKLLKGDYVGDINVDTRPLEVLTMAHVGVSQNQVPV